MWSKTCATCPMFEAMPRPSEMPADQEFRLGVCNGAPDVVCMTPVPAPQPLSRVIANPKEPPQQAMMLVPESFRRIVDSKRPACMIHPDWQLYVAERNAEAMEQLAIAYMQKQALREAPPEGTA